MLCVSVCVCRLTHFYSSLPSDVGRHLHDANHSVCEQRVQHPLAARVLQLPERHEGVSRRRDHAVQGQLRAPDDVLLLSSRHAGGVQAAAAASGGHVLAAAQSHRPSPSLVP